MTQLATTAVRPCYRDDGTPEPDMGRRVRLWERRIRNHGRWHPVTFVEMLADVSGGSYGRAAALAIEAMVRGEVVRTVAHYRFAHYRFRAAAARDAELAG